MSQENNQQDNVHNMHDELNNFTYTVSHDLGAPLRAVVSFSKLFKEKYEQQLDEKGKHYLSFITGGGEKAQAMLDGLLQYSRLHTRENPPVDTNTAMLLGKCHTALKEKIAACGASIQIISPDTMPVVVADSEQLFKLFMALLDNALTYHRPDAAPHVRIMVEENADRWRFLIQDNGIGIPPASTARIFEVFKRLHTDEEYPGIGMGLALARRIVERHGGTIGIYPAAKGGTVCWFTLPKPTSQRTYISTAREKAYG